MPENDFSFLTKDAIIIDSGIPGPSAMILGGIHGDEVSGVNIVKELMLHKPPIQKGKLLLMYGNLNAIRLGQRQTDENLNRMFLSDSEYSADQMSSYEYSRSMEIKHYLDHVDILLDIHSVKDPNGTPFIICESNGGKIAQYFPLPIRCSGFDTAHPGGTDGYMNSIKKTGICIETGYHNDPLSFERGMQCVLIFLKAIGLQSGLEDLERNISQKALRVKYIYHNKNAPFTLSKNFRDFEEIPEGTSIAYDGNEPIISTEAETILFARNRDTVGQEAFCFVEEDTEVI